MKQQIINDIQQKMRNNLNNEQRKQLAEVLEYVFFDVEIIRQEKQEANMEDYANLFVSAKRVEGCSERTLNYYKSTIDNMLDTINKKVNNIETEDLRKYLADYQEKRGCSKVTRYNDRRILSIYFAWL